MRGFAFFIVNHLSIFVLIPDCLLSDCTFLPCNQVALVLDVEISLTFFFLLVEEKMMREPSLHEGFGYSWHLYFYINFRLNLLISTKKSARVLFGNIWNNWCT